MSIQLTKLQQDYLAGFGEKVSIIADSRGCGATWAICMKAVAEGGLIITKDKHLLTLIIEEICSKLGWDFTIVSGAPRIQINNEIIIDFSNKVGHSLSHGYAHNGHLYIDSEVKFKPRQYDLLSRLLCRFDNVTFISSTQECGYRTPLIEGGDLVIDEEGEMVLADKSWDYDLINWKPQSTNTRASIEDYKDFVKVYNGYGISDFMPNSFVEAIEDLNSRDKGRVSGKWGKGVALVPLEKHVITMREDVTQEEIDNLKEIFKNDL